jgi:hypothetical protein
MTDKWHGGKGSKPRKVDPKLYGENWDKIFNTPWLDNPLEGDGRAHYNCGTSECCGECQDEET